MEEYQLNFIIPMGATGPKGELGPMNNNAKEIAIFYNNQNNSGNLEILDSINLSGQSIFYTVDNYIFFDVSGNYDFTISGHLRESSTFSGCSIIVRTNIQNKPTVTNDLIHIQLSNGQEEKYFLVERIGRYSVPQRVTILFNKNNDSDASVENLQLIIKKLF